MRKLLPVLLFLSLSVQSVFAQGAFTPEQYKKALWMVTRMYGGQRDGYGPNWLLIGHTYNTSFIKDGQADEKGNAIVPPVDLVGGWFDCGDNVLFGQTFFYSAYMLAKAYDVFPTGFHDLYDGTDYSDYVESGDWSINGGKPNGIPDLLEELKYATDWIIKATPDANNFYYQKGNGGGSDDHKLWITSATLPRSDGGESDKPRPVCKNPNDGAMASFAAATLAVMSKIYHKYDATYAAKALTHAKNAYAYAKPRKNQGAATCFGNFYGAMDANKVPMVFHIAASEMYKITGESTYLSDMLTSQVSFNWAFDYANPHDLAAYASASTITNNTQSYITNMQTEFVNRYTGQVNSEKLNTNGGDWGQLRYPANHAFSTALYSTVADNTTQYDQFIYNQIDYILGNNNAKQSFVVGFCEGCTKMASKPHHRNVYLDDNDNEGNHLTIPEKNKYFGYMVGGQRTSGSYVDDIKSYTNTEGGLDYNAGLLGALAYIVSKLAPADTSKFGVLPIDPDPDPSSIMSKPNGPLAQNSIIRFIGAYEFPAQNKSFTVQIFNSKGEAVSALKSNGQAIKYTPQNLGIYFARIRD